MSNTIWFIILCGAVFLAYRWGWENGVNYTLNYFTTHPLPKHFISQCRLDHSELVRESHSKGIQYVTCPDCDEELS